jgi:hypothetical protein
MNVKILPNLVFEDVKVNVVLVASPGHTNDIAEIINSISWVASSPHTVNCKNSGIIPALYSVCEDQFVEFSLGKHVVRYVQTRVLPNVGLVKV